MYRLMHNIKRGKKSKSVLPILIGKPPISSGANSVVREIEHTFIVSLHFICQMKHFVQQNICVYMFPWASRDAFFLGSANQNGNCTSNGVEVLPDFFRSSHSPLQRSGSCNLPNCSLEVLYVNMYLYLQLDLMGSRQFHWKIGCTYKHSFYLQHLCL